jgi:NADH:ubiquinone oxidoreductase subunit 6 (subunit J)
MQPFLLFVQDFWPILLATGLGLVAVYLLLPRARRSTALWGGAVAGLALLLAGSLMIHAEGADPETILFYTFSAIALIAGGMLLCQRNPVHAALSFALVVLATCGLFLLQAAPFLMAATAIIYAGAIIVTFLFVIMLAQQSGLSSADQRSREPFLASVAGFVLLGALLVVLRQTYHESDVDLETLNLLLTRVEQIAQAGSPDQVNQLLEDKEWLKTVWERKDMKKVGEAFKEKTGDEFEDLEFLQVFKEYIGFGLERDRADEQWLWPAWTQGARSNLKDLALEAHQIASMPKGKLNLPALKKALSRIHEESEKLAARIQLIAEGNLQPDVRPVSSFSDGVPQGGKLALPAENTRALGRSLFSDYLLAVELAGTLLLVATIGAIAIAGRHREGLR